MLDNEIPCIYIDHGSHSIEKEDNTVNAIKISFEPPSYLKETSGLAKENYNQIVDIFYDENDQRFSRAIDRIQASNPNVILAFQKYDTGVMLFVQDKNHVSEVINRIRNVRTALNNKKRFRARRYT